MDAGLIGDRPRDLGTAAFAVGAATSLRVLTELRRSEDFFKRLSWFPFLSVVHSCSCEVCPWTCYGTRGSLSSSTTATESPHTAQDEFFGGFPAPDGDWGV